MDKRITMKVSSDDYGVSVSLAEYGEHPVPACHTYYFSANKLSAFTDALFDLLRSNIEEEA